MNIIPIILFIFGSIFGSFLNVLIYRLPAKKSIAFPNSFCPQCKNPLRFYDNIPILSYLVLHGHCRDCHAPIPFRYFIVEFMNALLWMALYYKFGLSTVYFLNLILVSVLIVSMYTDLLHYRILNSVLLAGLIAAIMLIGFLHAGQLKTAIFGMLTGGGFMIFWAVVGELIFKKTALGSGDIKLIALIGIFTGPRNILAIIMLSFFIASLFGIISAVKQQQLKDLRLPLAPFIAVASIIIIFFDNYIIQQFGGFLA